MRKGVEIYPGTWNLEPGTWIFNLEIGTWIFEHASPPPPMGTHMTAKESTEIRQEIKGKSKENHRTNYQNNYGILWAFYGGNVFK